MKKRKKKQTIISKKQHHRENACLFFVLQLQSMRRIFYFIYFFSSLLFFSRTSPVSRTRCFVWLKKGCGCYRSPRTHDTARLMAHAIWFGNWFGLVCGDSTYFTYLYILYKLTNFTLSVSSRFQHTTSLVQDQDEDLSTPHPHL